MVSHRLHFMPRFGRDQAHRKAMMRNLVTSLIRHERILTTHTKAKFTQKYAERVIRYAKRGNIGARRRAAAIVNQSDELKKLYNVLVPRYTWRPSGFTRVIKVGRRRGDAAPVSFVEFIDRPGELRPVALCTPQTW
jgi:large subunit ribosomal protein L17